MNEQCGDPVPLGAPAELYAWVEDLAPQLTDKGDIVFLTRAARFAYSQFVTDTNDKGDRERSVHRAVALLCNYSPAELSKFVSRVEEPAVIKLHQDDGSDTLVRQKA